jgi:hypothetical protein
MELRGWCEALLGPAFQLAFLQYMHGLDPGHGRLSGLERCEPQQGKGDPLHAAMIMFHEMVEVVHLADADCRAPRFVGPPHGGRMGLAPVDGDGLRHPMTSDGLGQKAWGRVLVPLCREAEGYLSGPSG